jgi:hypothetical protein
MGMSPGLPWSADAAHPAAPAQKCGGEVSVPGTRFCQVSQGASFLPWSQYRGYLVTGSLLMIRQWGGERWGKLPVRTVPNLHILIGLLDQIQRSQRESVLSGPFPRL